MRPAAQSLASFLFSRFILLAHDPSRPIVASRKIAYSHARSPRAGTQDRHDAHELSQMLAVCGRVPTHGTPLRNDEVRPHKRPTAFLFHLHSSQIGHQLALVDCTHRGRCVSHAASPDADHLEVEVGSIGKVRARDEELPRAPRLSAQKLTRASLVAAERCGAAASADGEQPEGRAERRMRD